MVAVVAWCFRQQAIDDPRQHDEESGDAERLVDLQHALPERGAGRQERRPKAQQQGGKDDGGHGPVKRALDPVIVPRRFPGAGSLSFKPGAIHKHPWSTLEKTVDGGMVAALNAGTW